ncbi:MAG: DUF5615 family PIN-like protein [Flavobacteriales bacterium]
MIRFLADEDFPAPATKVLREHGLDVVSIQEESSGFSDVAVVQKARGLNAVILTFDGDYGDLIFRDGVPSPPAVIFFRAKGTSPVDVALRLIELMDELNFDPVGKFTVISEGGVRERRY